MTDCWPLSAIPPSATARRAVAGVSKDGSFGYLAGGVAHNFNNLLQVVIGGISLGLIDLESGNPAQAKQSLDQVLEARGSAPKL